MKTITMISTLPPVKGVSPYTLGLVKELSKLVHIHFIGFKAIYPECLYPGGTKTDEPVPTIENLDNRSFLTWYNPFTWLWAGLTCRGEVVHAQWWAWPLAFMYLTILGIAKLRRKRVIVTIHNIKPHEPSRVKSFLHKVALWPADEYIVHSEYNRQTLLEELHTTQKVHVIPIGMETKDQVDKDVARAYLGIVSKRTVLFFGNVRAYKGVDVLLAAKAYLPKDTQLMIVGRTWDKRIRALLKNDDDIIFRDEFIPHSEVKYYFSAADLVVLPYKYFNASSSVGADAISYGKAVVVTNTGGLDHLVQNENLIAEAGNSKDLAQKIGYVIDNLNAIESRVRIGADEFGWPQIARRTTDTCY